MIDELLERIDMYRKRTNEVRWRQEENEYDYQTEHLPSRARQVHGTLDDRCPVWCQAAKAVKEKFAQNY